MYKYNCKCCGQLCVQTDRGPKSDLCNYCENSPDLIKVESGPKLVDMIQAEFFGLQEGGAND